MLRLQSTQGRGLGRALVGGLALLSLTSPLVAPAGAQDAGELVAKHFAVRYMPLGTRIGPLVFRDTSGLVTIDPGKAHVTVITFVAASCGTSMAYNQQMYDLYRTYAPKHVQFYFVDSYFGFEDGERQAWRKRADSLPIGHLVHGDVGSHLANRLSPTHTPEMFIFDSAGVLRYHGSVDNGSAEPGGEYRPQPATLPYAQLALDALLAGRPVQHPLSKAFGCMVHAIAPPGAGGGRGVTQHGDDIDRYYRGTGNGEQ